MRNRFISVKAVFLDLYFFFKKYALISLVSPGIKSSTEYVCFVSLGHIGGPDVVGSEYFSIICLSVQNLGVVNTM